MAAAPPRALPPGSGCHYCDGNHLITNCPVVEEDIALGRIVRNDVGRVQLPSGSYVPRQMDGKNMRERIINWHKSFPGRLAANLLFESYDEFHEAYMAAMALEANESDTASSYMLEAFAMEPSPAPNLEAKIRDLTAQLNELRRARPGPAFDGVEVPPPPNRRRVVPAAAEPGANPAPAVAVPKPVAKPVAAKPAAPKPVPQVSGPFHPFEQARDATYVPTLERPDAPAARQAARVRAPVESNRLTSLVFDRMFQKSQVAMSPEELLAVSPELRAKCRAAVTPRRPEAAAAGPPKSTMEHAVASDDLVPSVEQARFEYEQGRGGLLDTQEVYLNETGDGPPEEWQVATESEQIRTVTTDLLKITHPIMLAGMNVAAGPKLAAAVTNAGGIGVIGGVGYTPDMLREQIAELKSFLNDKNAPFGVDFLIPQVGGSARKTK